VCGMIRYEKSLLGRLGNVLLVGQVLLSKLGVDAQCY